MSWFFWVLLLIACGGSGLESDALEDAVLGAALPIEDTTLDDEAYRFCHEAGYNAQDAMRWCELLEGMPEERCPGLRETCQHEGELDYGWQESGCNEQRGGEKGDQFSGQPERPDVREPRGCDQDVAAPEASGALLKWVVAAFIAAGVLVLMRILWSYIGLQRDANAPVVHVLEPATDLGKELPDVPDLPSKDLLAAARAALDRGDVGEAVLLARGASLRSMGEDGRLRLHRSKTDREYARSVRKEADLHSDLRQVLDAVEVHKWGGQLLDAEFGKMALAAASRILGAGLMLVFLGLVAPVAHAQTRYDAFGDAGLYDIYDAWGYDVTWRLRGLENLDDTTDVLVLDLTFVAPTEADWEATRRWVNAGGVLVVGGDASIGFPELGVYEDELNDGIGWSTALDEPFASALPEPRWPGGARAVWEGGEGRTWVRGGDTKAVVKSVDIGVGVVVCIADPHLLWNGALVDTDNEVFLGDLVYVGQSMLGWPLPTPVGLQLATMAGTADPGPARALANANLLPFVLQLLLFWTVVALWRGYPFGPLRDPPGEGRLHFADHVNALGSRYQRLQATRFTTSAFARLWLARMGPAGLQLAAQRAGQDADGARRFVATLEAVAADPDGQNQPSDFDLMEELWRVTRK